MDATLSLLNLAGAIALLLWGNGMDPALAAEWNLERQLR
jgi:hypothetical protein